MIRTLACAHNRMDLARSMYLFVGIRRFANGNDHRRRKIERTRLFEVEIYDGARALRTRPDIVDALIALDAAPRRRDSPANAAGGLARSGPHRPNTRGDFFGMVQYFLCEREIGLRRLTPRNPRHDPTRPGSARDENARASTRRRAPPCLERAHVSVGRARGIANSSKKTAAPLPGRADRA